MDDTPQSSWRQMFDRDRQQRSPTATNLPRPASIAPMPAAPARPFGYDDGYDPARQQAATQQPHQIMDEAALALADDTQEYRPWVLQRGARPSLLLHLRRYDAKAGHWTGWQISYSHLLAVEYQGERMLSLDFGTRQFVIEGDGLAALTAHLQSASVQMVQEFTPSLWRPVAGSAMVRSLRCLASQ